MSGDLARMQSDDSSIVAAVLSANVSGLNAYETTVVRATAAILARQTIFTPLDNVCVGDEMQVVDCDDLKSELRAFYVDTSPEERETIQMAHAELRESVEQAIECEDKERQKAWNRESMRKRRASQRAMQSTGVGVDG